MTDKKNDIFDGNGSKELSTGKNGCDPLGSTEDLTSQDVPPGVDRRSFLIRSAVVGAAALMTGKTISASERTYDAVRTMPAGLTITRGLHVHQTKKGPIMTTIDELFKVGPGPSSSHTIGVMRSTFDFSERVKKLPADKLAKATTLQVNLFGSLSATGLGHGTERAALAGLIGKEPATVDPLFLDGLKEKPDQKFTVKVGSKDIPVTLKNIIYDATKGAFPHQNTLVCHLKDASGEDIYSLEYYSIGGGFIEWKGYTPPDKKAPKYPFQTMKELRAHAENNKLSIGQVILANEMSIMGRTEAEMNVIIDKVINAMLLTVKAGLAVPEGNVLPGPIKLHGKAGTVYKRAMDQPNLADRGVGLLSAAALAASEENARGHWVITAPTGGSAGVLPSLIYAMSEARRIPIEKLREAMLTAAGVGYIIKHHATFAAAEGGCQAEIGSASSMAAGMVAAAHGATPRVVENAAESALEHHLGLTCDPVAGFVQVPCIERCAFGAVKAWTAYAVASNEIASSHRVSFDECVQALAETCKDMNSKYKETSEAGLALSVVLC